MRVALMFPWDPASTRAAAGPRLELRIAIHAIAVDNARRRPVLFLVIRYQTGLGDAQAITALGVRL